MGRGTAIVGAVLILASAGAAVGHVNWPATTADWYRVTRNGGPYVEPDDQTPAEIDLRGDATFNTGYWFSDGIDLMFRLRVDKAPSANTQQVWQVLMDSDGDDYVEWSLQWDAKNDDKIELNHALTGGPLWTDVQLNEASFWSDPTPSPYGRFVSPTDDGSNFDGNADGFVDVAIPWVSLTHYSGITPTTWLRVAFSTSSNHNNINKDLPDGWSDPIFTPEIVVPEPASLGLQALTLALVGARLRRRKSAE